MKKPDCYKCKHRETIPGDCHSACGRISAKIEGDSVGRRNGWFMWPLNFDPVWLINCDSFEPIKKQQTKVNITISKKDFKDFEKVRKSGITNMFDIAKVVASSRGLTKEKCVYIMKNYTDLKTRYGGE